MLEKAEKNASLTPRSVTGISGLVICHSKRRSVPISVEREITNPQPGFGASDPADAIRSSLQKPALPGVLAGLADALRLQLAHRPGIKRPYIFEGTLSSDPRDMAMEVRILWRRAPRGRRNVGRTQASRPLPTHSRLWPPPRRNPAISDFHTESVLACDTTLRHTVLLVPCILGD
jgi:hypothetical protein